MIYLPPLNKTNATRSVISAFGGLDHRLVISEGNFFIENNLTSDEFPVLANRRKHGTYASLENDVSDLIVNDTLWYISGKLLYKRDSYGVDKSFDIGLNSGRHTMVNMGAYIIIAPEMVYINTAKTSDYGNLANKIVKAAGVDAEIYVTDETGAVPKIKATEPSVGDLSVEEGTLVRYDGEAWVPVLNRYFRIAFTGVGEKFSVGEAVKLECTTPTSTVQEVINGLQIIADVGNDYVAFKYNADPFFSFIVNTEITVSRDVPYMSHITVAGNRLWGCFKGIPDSASPPVNEIYASKLGEFKVFNYFQGTAADSYAVSVGSDGSFTGAFTYQDTPMFFKEDTIYQITGSYPANYTLQAIEGNGVKVGCGKSLSVIDSTLFFVARDGVNTFSGGFPTNISQALGNGVFSGAVGGAHKRKYYVNMADEDGKRATYVYDTSNGIWHRQDEGFSVTDFASMNDELYYAVGKEVKTMFGSGTVDSVKTRWYAETGLIGTDSPDTKYLSKLTLRMALSVGSTVMISVQYDSLPEWIPVANLSGVSLSSFSLPIKLDRCDHLRLRFDGVGDCRIFSLAKTVEAGGSA